MYTLNILLPNMTGLNSAVKRTCVLEYLHRKSISGALICNTASYFSSCVLGVSCGHGSVAHVDLVLSSSLQTDCFADTSVCLLET